MRRLLPLVAVLLVSGRAAADTTLTRAGTIDATDATYTLVPFDVPAGIAEIEVQHVLVEDGGTDILDFGLWDANGYRGWGGGNTEDIVVGLSAASRSYHPGPIPTGTWNIVIGKALVASAAPYAITITLRTTATLPAETDRTPYTPVPALKTTPGWYAGDFHVHSRESGDARPTLDLDATVARANGLDFIEYSDHNVDSQIDLIPQVQAQHADILLIPGDEFTTYSGHANGIGATHYVDHRLGLNGRLATQAADELHAEGALFSINHPELNLGSLCLGCAWKNDDVTADQVDGIEIENGGWNEVGSLFAPTVYPFWEGYLNLGRHVAPLGGSDDHRAGIDEGTFGSVISHPTTMVYATELSVAGILDGVRNGHTVVKLESGTDPMIDLTSGDYRVGDTIHATTAHLTAVVTGGNGQQVRWVNNGAPQPAVDVTSDPFSFETDITAPATGESRWRAEILEANAQRTITSHIWITAAPLPAPDAGTSISPTPKTGCGCGSGDAAGFVSGLGFLALLGLRRRKVSA